MNIFKIFQELIAGFRDGFKFEWRTTVMALIGAIILAGSDLIAWIDLDPETVANFDLLIEALILFVIGAFAKDGRQSDDDTISPGAANATRVAPQQKTYPQRPATS